MKISNHSLDNKPVVLRRAELREMIRLVRILFQLSKNPAYQAQLQDTIPDIAKFDPTNDAVMMGYDFHLSETGPKLIEVNSNAGGLWLAWQVHYPESKGFNGKLHDALISMFLNEYSLWCKEISLRPRAIAIIDELPNKQFLYTEMQAFAELLSAQHIPTFILDPSELNNTRDGLSYRGIPIDLIYNRHCDFYLQSSELANIRNAWLKRQICLSPNPHAYALLADKQRLCDWSTPEKLSRFNLSHHEQAILTQSIPKTRLLATQNFEQTWHDRKQLVFKPTTAYASRGVYLGKKITTHKFATLDTENTIIQTYVAPSTHTAEDGQIFKTDFRLFAYQQRILSVAARQYQGQVTNLREGGGFAKVSIL